jgi:hypothetical protein
MHEFSLHYRRILDVPVYRRTVEQHADHLRKTWWRTSGKQLEEMGMGEAFLKRSWDGYLDPRPPYRFNQVIGWVEIGADRGRVLGDCWRQRYSRARRKLNFWPAGRVFEFEITRDDTDDSIRLALTEHLHAVTSSEPFKGNHIDLLTFEHVAPYIRWRDLVVDHIPVPGWMSDERLRTMVHDQDEPDG